MAIWNGFQIIYITSYKLSPYTIAIEVFSKSKCNSFQINIYIYKLSVKHMLILYIGRTVF